MSARLGRLRSMNGKAMEKGLGHLGAGWSLAVLCALVLVGAIVRVLPGSGVQTTLDASQGLEDGRFLASQRTAFLRMSPVQVEAFEWAMGQLNGELFIQRYGRSPSVRQVVVGEVMRAVDARRREIETLRGKLAGMEKLVEETEIRRQRALDALGRVRPSVTQVDREEHGYSVRYRIDLPAGVSFKRLPCNVIYRGRDQARERRQGFDCVDRPRMPSGEYRVALLGMKQLPVAVVIEAQYDLATLIAPATSAYFVPPQVPEVTALQEAQRDMNLVLRYKTAM